MAAAVTLLTGCLVAREMTIFMAGGAAAIPLFSRLVWTLETVFDF
jgi:hypothetical protein